MRDRFYSFAVSAGVPCRSRMTSTGRVKVPMRAAGRHNSEGASMILRQSSRAVLLTVMVAAAAAGCRKKDEAEQIGETVGEAMSSLDESVSGESTAMFRFVPSELKGSPWRRALDNVIPSAYAGTCWEPAFSACSATGVRTKDF